MGKKGLNVSMYPAKGNKEIFDEIKKENLHGGTLVSINPRVCEEYDIDLEKRLAQFDYISHALVIGKCHTNLHLIQKGTRFGLFSSMYSFSGKTTSIILPAKYLQVAFIDSGNEGFRFMTMDENFKWGIERVLPFIFDDINSPTNGFFPVNFHGKWGLYFSKRFSKIQEMVIEPQYEDALRFSEGLWGVKKNGKWGFVDIFNNEAVPFEYTEISDFSCGYAKAINKDGNSILLNHKGKEVVFKNKQLVNANYRKKIRVIDSYGYYYAIGPDDDILIPKNKYNYLGKYSEGLFAASLDGKTYGYIDINEDIVIPFQYQLEVHPYSGILDNTAYHWGCVCVRLNNEKYSKEHILINHSNEQVFPYIFQCHDRLEFENGQFLKHGWSTIGDRFKRNSISLYDLIICKQGKDMSHLIRTDAEVEAEKMQRKRQRQRELEEHYDWTEEDTWDAMTDGMYGDYPGGDVDYDAFGF